VEIIIISNLIVRPLSIWAYGPGRGNREFVDPTAIKNLIELEALWNSTFTEKDR